MSAIASHSPVFPSSRTVHNRPFTGFCLRLLDAARDWRIRVRQRRELMMLNGAELRELSLTEADVDRETRKSFWESVDISGH